MKLLEYEAKQILEDAGIPVPNSWVVTKTDTPKIKYPVVVKSQVPVGGRGKLGGVVGVADQPAFERAVATLFNLNIKGYLPNKLLAEERISIDHELYIAVVINKSCGTIELLAQKNGGVEVENNATSDFLRLSLEVGTSDVRGEQLAEYYDLPGQTFALQDMVENLHSCFTQNDATLIEINPLIYTTDAKLVAGDAKIELDSSAAFRHLNWDFEEQVTSANFVILDPEGTIATIANGAGLAMATVDAVQAAGMTPANFLDIGGGANTASVTAAFEKIMTFGNVRAIVINIFAGITRCDEVARAIVAATESFPDLPPLFIRLSGTGSAEATEILQAAAIETLPSLERCIIGAQESRNG